VIGEAWCVRRGECAATLLAQARGQRVGEVIVPGPREPLDIRFQLLVRDLGDLHARLDVHGEEDLGGLGLPQGEVVVHGDAVEALHEHVLQAFAEPRGEPLTREGDDDRHLATEEILPDQDPDPGLLLELEQTDDERSELFGRSLEQLVLREGPEELDDRLVVVRARDQVLGRQDLLQLVVQQGGLGGRLHVRLRREQTDQPRLSGDPSVGRDLAHPHVVHPGSAMDGRVGLRLRDHEQIPVLDPLTDVRGKAVERRDVGERAPRDPEPSVALIARPSGRSSRSYSR